MAQNSYSSTRKEFNIKEYRLKRSEIRRRLIELRECAGLTVKELAEMLAVDIEVVNDWEEDYGVPRNITIAKLAMFFGVSADYILCLSDNLPYGWDETYKPKYCLLKGRIS